MYILATHLDGLVDGFLYVAAHVVNLIDTAHRFVGIGYVDGGHVKACTIEAGPLAQLLDDLHHDPLSIGLMTGLISLGQVEANLFGMFDT